MSDASARARKLLAEPLGAQILLSHEADRVLAEVRGLLAALAGEVEEHEAGRRFSKVVVRETYTDAEVGRHVAALTAENARLREALVEARRYDHAINEYDEGGDVECTCGVDAHNARIAAALRGEEGTSVNESRIHAPIVFVKVCASCGHVAHDPDCPEAIEILDVTLRHTSERP